MAEVVLDDVARSTPTARTPYRTWISYRRRRVHGVRRAFGLRQDDRAPHGRGAGGHHRGTVRIGDRVVNDVPSKDRDIAMVFQNYALYPAPEGATTTWPSGCSCARSPRARSTGACETRPTVLGLEELLDRKPKNLSGGQRQRVAMGRAIVREPQAFLMDEPLSNLDAKLRVQMRAEIARIQRDLGVTTIYVTHDQTEAMTMGDRVAVIKQGRLQQVDTPQVLYDAAGRTCSSAGSSGRRR